MRTLAGTSLSADEAALLQRFAEQLSATLHDYFAGRDPDLNFSATALMGG